MRRKMKKLVHILTEKEFDDWYVVQEPLPHYEQATEG